jgi:hypothetical protein
MEKYLCWFAHIETYVPHETMINKDGWVNLYF